jgi:hypothetical protein
MSEVKGKIKILENKIVLKTDKGSETYIKTRDINVNSWIQYKGDFYELDTIWESSEEEE